MQRHEFAVYLQSELVRRCGRNPSYSIRAFARSLAMDPSTLAKILSGKRKPGIRLIRSMGKRLGLNAEAVEKFHPTNPAINTASSSTDQYEQLRGDLTQVVSQWYYFALLELMTVDHFKSEYRWVARVLGISIHEAKAAVALLERVGMLEIDSEGRWIDKSSGKTTTILPQISTAEMRDLQRQFLSKAQSALDNVDIQYRDQTAITMAIDVKKIPQAKEKIKEFRRSLAKYLCRGGERNDVYNLMISLYPLTQMERGTE